MSTSAVKADDRLAICNRYVEMINNNGFNFNKYSSSNIKFLPVYNGYNCGPLPGTKHHLNIYVNPVRALGVGGTHYFTLPRTVYAGHLTLIKNKLLTDSSI